MLSLASCNFDGTVRLEATGEVDVASASDLFDEAKRLLDGGTTLLLDLRGVTFIDSVGIRVLLDVRRHAVQRGARLELVCASEPVGRLLRCATLEDALGAVIE